MWERKIGIARPGGKLPQLQEMYPEVYSAASGWSVTVTSFMTFTLIVSLLTGVGFGLAPALTASKPDLTGALKESGRSGAGRLGRRGLRNALVVMEVALSLALLVGAGLLIRSFWRVQAVDPGFRAENVLTMGIALPQTKYPDKQQVANFYQQVLRQVETLPGAQAAGLIAGLPLGGSSSAWGFTTEAKPRPSLEEVLEATNRVVSPGYFRAMSIPLRRGRDFAAQDNESAPGAVVINETMARRLWPNEDPIGKRIKLGSPEPQRTWDGQWLTIIGVVGDVRATGLESEANPEMYLNYLQNPWRGMPNRPYMTLVGRAMSLVARSSVDPTSLAAAIRQAVATVDKDQPVTAVATMESLLYGVSATDPWTFAAAPVLLAPVARLACYPPARRATKVDPILGGIMQTLWQDLRYGARMLMKKPGFTLIAVIMLSLGIGANTAIFTVVNAVLLRPLSYPEPERIMRLAPEWPNASFMNASEPKFIFWRERSQSFDGVTATIGIGSGVNLSGVSEPEFVTGVRVSADFFRVLGARPTIGRGFTNEEDSPSGEPVVILSHGLWHRRFGADPDIAGKSVSINGNPYTVVGVTPEDFRYGDRQTDVFVPMRVNPASAGQGHNYTVLARLKANVSRAQALAEMKPVFEQFKAAYPNQLWRNEAGIRVEPYLASMTAEARPMLLILLGAVSFVLLIACANVANLQLTQATTRRKEMALRQALGASRWSLTRQLLTEGMLLALLGGGLGLLLAAWGVEALTALLPQGLIPRSGEIGFDWRVLAFTLGAAVMTGLVFALAPALQASRVDVNHALKEGAGKGAIGGERGRMRSALVVAEIALALALLAGAGLLVRTLANLRHVDPGFDPGNVLTFEVAPNGKQYETTAQNVDYFRRALERIGSLPGVETAAVTSNLPLGAWLNFGVGVAGKPDSLGSTEIRMITPDYFKVMKMSMRRGRAFTGADSAGAPPAIIVNESYARRIFPNADPIGQSLTVEGSQVYQIIGVVNDVKQFSLGDPAPRTVFIPVAQTPDRVMRGARQFVTMKFAIRTAGDPLALGAAVKQEMLNVDPSLPLTNVRSLEQIVARSLAQARFNSTLLGLFAAIGLLLAAIGVYGVMSYAVTQRTHEIGVRVALGATAGDVLKLIIGKGLALALAGVALGLGASFALTRLMKDFLFGVKPTDPLTFGVIASLLTAVALVACYIPARRATRVDPLVALRRE